MGANGQYHVCLLSTFMIYAIFTVVYSLAFGIQTVLLYIAFSLAVLGPCWTSISISDKLKIAGFSSAFMSEVRELKTTNLSLRANLDKYKREIYTLTSATSQVTKESHDHRTVLRKAIHVGRKMEGEKVEIEKEI